MGYTRLHGFNYMNFEIWNIFWGEAYRFRFRVALNTPRALRALGWGIESIDLDYPNQFISSRQRRLDKTLFASNLNSLATLNAGVDPGGYAPPQTVDKWFFIHLRYQS